MKSYIHPQNATRQKRTTVISHFLYEPQNHVMERAGNFTVKKKQLMQIAKSQYNGQFVKVAMLDSYWCVVVQASNYAGKWPCHCIARLAASTTAPTLLVFFAIDPTTVAI